MFELVIDAGKRSNSVIIFNADIMFDNSIAGFNQRDAPSGGPVGRVTVNGRYLRDLAGFGKEEDNSIVATGYRAVLDAHVSQARVINVIVIGTAHQYSADQASALLAGNRVTFELDGDV